MKLSSYVAVHVTPEYTYLERIPQVSFLALLQKSAIQVLTMDD